MSRTVSVSRRSALAVAVGTLALGASLGLTSGSALAALPNVTVWKSAQCGCCGGWVRHMQQAGFDVVVHDVDDVQPIKDRLGVPAALASCHTAVVGRYVLEGHVPADDVKRLLAEQPEARGLAVPGMPAAAPGMDQTGPAYTVVLFGAPAGDRTYAQH